MGPLEHLDADGLTLRRLQLPDRDLLAGAVRESVAALSAWMPWAYPGYGPHDASTFLAAAWLGWEARTHFEFAVERRGELLGLCGLNQRDGDSMNLGYWVRSCHAGGGVATVAARRVARFGFEDVGLRRLTLYHAVDNVASGRVAEKVGFRLEGRQRGRLMVQGVLHDCLSYALLSVDEIRPAGEGPGRS